LQALFKFIDKENNISYFSTILYNINIV